MGVKVFVEHGSYGCDTGCCGHWVTIERDGETQSTTFTWEHPGYSLKTGPISETYIEFARSVVESELGRDHVADLDWDRCVILDD